MTDARALWSPDTDGYQTPDEALVSAALARTGDLQHRRVFYSQLENPKWVTALAARNAFASAPDLVFHPDGGVTAPPWAEGEYLARMAAHVPSEVATVLRPLADTDNVVVQRAVVQAASQMPAHVAAMLIDPIVDYMDQPYRGWLDPRALAAIVRALAEAELTKPALRLAQALYRPRVGGGRNSRGHDVAAGLDPYAYGMTLPDLVPALAQIRQALTTAVIWLEQWQLLTGNYRPSSGVDNSSIWRPSISPDAQNQRHGDEIGHALVDAVRGIAFAQYAAGRPVDEIVRTIERGRQPIHARLVMYFIARAINNANERVNDTEESAHVAVGLQEQAISHLMNPAFLAAQYRHEYALLARVAVPVLPGQTVATWAQWINGAPHETEEVLRQRLRVYRQDSADATEAEVTAYRAGWLRDLLAGIGEQALPDLLRERLQSLVASYGPAREHVDFPVHMSWGFIGPNSPLSVQELEKLDTDEILTYLNTWRPGEDQIFGPSIEGLARNLTQLVKSAPARFAERADDLVRVDPAYIQGALQGFETALTEGRGFPWTPILRLIQYVATASSLGHAVDVGVGEVEEGDPWRSTQLLAANLLMAGIVAGQDETQIPDDLLDLAWSSLNPLTTSQDPTADTESRYGGDNMDPLTLSMNTVRPTALRAAIRLLLRLSRPNEDLDPETTAARSLLTTRTEAALGDHSGPNRDPSLAVAAAFGEGLGVLLAAAPEWTTKRLTSLLGPPDPQGQTDDTAQAWHDTVWSVMLAGYRPSRALLQALRPWFVHRVTELASNRAETVGFRGDRSPRQLLADHILMLRLTGQLDNSAETDLVRAMFNIAPPELLGEVLGHVGWQLMHAEGDVSAAVLERCQALWDWRASEVRAGRADPQELAGFSWWVRSGHFPAEWWLPHLMLAIADDSFQARTTLLESLANVAPAHPRQALEALIALIENDDDATMTFYIDRYVPAVIAAALDYGDTEVARTAWKLMDRLGRRGYTDLDRQVANARRS